MKVITQKEFEENFDYYSDLVGEKKETIEVVLDNKKCIRLIPILDEEAIK